MTLEPSRRSFLDVIIDDDLRLVLAHQAVFSEDVVATPGLDTRHSSIMLLDHARPTSEWTPETVIAAAIGEAGETARH